MMRKFETVLRLTITLLVSMAILVWGFFKINNLVLITNSNTFNPVFRILVKMHQKIMLQRTFDVFIALFFRPLRFSEFLILSCTQFSPLWLVEVWECFAQDYFTNMLSGLGKDCYFWEEYTLYTQVCLFFMAQGWLPCIERIYYSGGGVISQIKPRHHVEKTDSCTTL